jgi:hypothetical protein
LVLGWVVGLIWIDWALRADFEVSEIQQCIRILKELHVCSLFGGKARNRFARGGWTKCHGWHHLIVGLKMQDFSLYLRRSRADFITFRSNTLWPH